MGQLILSMGPAWTEVCILAQGLLRQVRGFFFYIFLSPHVLTPCYVLLNCLHLKYISPLHVKSKLCDADIKHAFTLGPIAWLQTLT